MRVEGSEEGADVAAADVAAAAAVGDGGGGAAVAGEVMFSKKVTRASSRKEAPAAIDLRANVSIADVGFARPLHAQYHQ